MQTNDPNAVKSELYEKSEPFLSAHTNYNMSTLSSWIAKNMEVVCVYGNRKKGMKI